MDYEVYVNGIRMTHEDESVREDESVVWGGMRSTECRITSRSIGRNAEYQMQLVI